MSASLLEAVSNNNITLVREVLKGDYGPIDWNEKDLSGMNCIHVAVSKCYYEIACELLRSEKKLTGLVDNVYSYMFHGCTALHLVSSRRDSNEKFVSLLAEHGADLNARTLYEKWTPLHFAAKEGNSLVVQELIKCGADVNATNVYEQTALHMAVHHLDVVSCLLDYGCQVNRLDEYKRSALYYAALEGQAKVVKLLIDSGAVVDILDVKKETVLFAVARVSPCIEIFKLLLDCTPKLLNRPYDGCTLLHMVVERHQVDEEVIQFLIVDANIDINATDMHEITAFGYACRARNLTTATLLLKFDCDINIGAEKNILAWPTIGECFLPVFPLISHCKKLRILNRTVSEHYLNEYKDLFVIFTCDKDVNILKFLRLTVEDSDRVITCYDILTCSIGCAADYLQHVDKSKLTYVKSFLERNVFKDMVLIKMELAYKRIALINRFKSSYQVTKLGSLPVLCVDYIIRYLSNSDLQNAIYAVSEK